MSLKIKGIINIKGIIRSFDILLFEERLEIIPFQGILRGIQKPFILNLPYFIRVLPTETLKFFLSTGGLNLKRTFDFLQNP